MTTTQETDYLAALVWDGTPRIDRWLIDYAGASKLRRTNEPDADALKAYLALKINPNNKS